MEDRVITISLTDFEKFIKENSYGEYKEELLKEKIEHFRNSTDENIVKDILYGYADYFTEEIKAYSKFMNS